MRRNSSQATQFIGSPPVKEEKYFCPMDNLRNLPPGEEYQ